MTENRNSSLKRREFAIVRFTNEETDQQLDEVVEAIA
ncbi:MAG: DUF559 domain-containing protein [Nostoc sp.]